MSAKFLAGAEVLVFRAEIEIAAKMDRARLEIRALTGWSDAAVVRFLRRLNKLAQGSPRMGTLDYYREWKRRSCEGWRYRHDRRRALFNSQ